MTKRPSLEIRDALEMRAPYHTNKGGARQIDNREFIAWDGEGITPSDQHQQNYVLFGNSKGYVTTGYSLSTLECFELMMMAERENPLAIHVGFAIGYDAEMILKDLPLRHMQVLHRNGNVRWNGYRIEYRKGKWLQVTLKNDDEYTVCKIWDVWSFFSTSFVVALQEYLGNDADVEYVAAGKQRRQTFTYDDLDTLIRPYWETELRLLVRLMESLRARLYGADLRITHWHGPGAIATYAMTQRGVKKSMAIIPDEVAEASRFAYAGGRFELFKIGHHHDRVFSYDIRSAYPAAIRELPNLSTGSWHHEERPQTVERFGIYRIRFRHPELFTTRPMPFPFRDHRSAVHFPNIVEGWYWSPEARTAQYLGNDAEIVEAWIYEDDGSRPFWWIEEIYERRAEWKREGNPSQIALKLLMNSMYGKFAQRVGFKGDKSPTWHQLEWAGYITSFTRARLFQAMLEAYANKSLVSVETDGIFTTEPLHHLTIGEHLGEWEVDEYDELLYLQSGFYFKNKNGQWTSKYRGFDKDSVTLEQAIAALGKWTPWKDDATIGEILGTSTRFTTMGQYLRMRNADEFRRTWSTDLRVLKLGTDGKRIHRPLFCQACAQGVSPADMFHDMTIYQPVGGFTFPHILPWIPTNRDNPFRLIEEGVSRP